MNTTTEDERAKLNDYFNRCMYVAQHGETEEIRQIATLELADWLNMAANGGNN